MKQPSSSRLRFFTAATMSAVLIGGAALCLDAQSSPRFEVVSIKPNASDDTGSRVLAQPDGRFVMTNAPVSAIVTQAVWSGVLVLSGSLSQLVSYTGFAVVLFAGIAVGALFVLRRREPSAERPFRAWGYPWTTALAAVIGVVFLIGVAYSDTRHAVIALACLVASYPLYRGMRMLRAVVAPG